MTWDQKRVFLFSHPRTASNLLTRILSKQPDWNISDYIFFDAHQYTRDTFDGIALEKVSRATWAEHTKLINHGHNHLHTFVRDSLRDHRHLLLKDHAHLVTPVEVAYGDECVSPTRSSAIVNGMNGLINSEAKSNPTIFSDELMLSWRPLFLIRSPILVFESWLMAEGEPYPDLESQYAKIYTTLRFQRHIFDWYKNHATASTTPIVVDADDVIEHPEVIGKLCDIVGMDKEQLLWAWEASPTPEKFLSNERFKRFLQSISDSVGIDRSKTSFGVTLEDRELDWKKTFGPERAAQLASRVNESWPDYEYLHSMKLS
ncbi:hypothetical protein EJ05DRAFT_510657 [Pseudovirgaria hyperparasitica]|uniref:Sulfotransferase domain-containing protein n=1 Tax=Pseudovirgaria hyperparasitica TaxID=470096 RepID=A0A6A6WCD7_9PEZI|nr:uncharacterized protein EJ05DRAFT_510657 [Pseudovirgaria hyperparasitica]KAF2758771.1 hypothetical protein EJ05DRAFT_510657 [Pseudovirgaria hyperparasitica]